MENFLARPRALNLRFIIQPTLASIIALRAGLKTLKQAARLPLGGFHKLRLPENFSAWWLERFAYPDCRRHNAGRSLQIIIHVDLSAGVAIHVTLLVLVPYLILRAVNRIASRFVSGGGADAAGRIWTAK